MSTTRDRPRVVGVGELLWDRLGGTRRPGGAPANFAVHAASMGVAAGVVSAVGADADGEELRRRLDAAGVDTSAVVVDAAHPTGSVDVTTTAEGQPRFEVAADVAWDHIPPTEAVFASASAADAVCFGTLALRSPASRDTLTRFLRSLPRGTMRLLDLNLRDPFWSPALVEEALALAGALKVNERELDVLAGIFPLGAGWVERIDALHARFGLNTVALTLGEHGSVLSDGTCCDRQPGLCVDVSDTVGAGDAFCAAMVVHTLAGDAPADVNRAANEAAARSCARASKWG